MSLTHLARYALSLPLHIAVLKACSYGGRVADSYLRQITRRNKSAYSDPGSGKINRYVNGHDIGWREEIDDTLIAKTINHEFNLLGSGWTKVAAPPRSAKLSHGNRARSSQIRSLIDNGYTAIDWQLDFKSGYRWQEDRLSPTLRYGHEPGVDVKVPWELSRLQHLPWLARKEDQRFVDEFRNQVLDFASANPPGYGVNWLCTMDVAIRAVNLLVAHDLFLDRGVVFDEEFSNEYLALIRAHGEHIATHLEWHDLHRGNHYLADIAGLLFVAAYLPRSAETDVWLAFSVQQLIKEVERQFTPDGANFEASTSYHRLSSEMVIYATALVLGLPGEKTAALSDFDPQLWQGHPALNPEPIKFFPIPGGEIPSPFPSWYFERLERMAEFSLHSTKPNQRIVQIGDNDSGRFLKLIPSILEVDGELIEQHLDHRATVSAINGLFNRADFATFSGLDFAPEAKVIQALTGGVEVASYLRKKGRVGALGRTLVQQEQSADAISAYSETIIELPEPEVLRGLEFLSYPDFGLYVWRSERFFLSVRCGPVGQNGNGGHAHNDQLSIELNVDGKDWIADPGTYLYTPSPDERNAYRSAHAHGAPKIPGREPSRLDLGLFRLEDNAKARCLRFDHQGFEGCHMGYGQALRRRIELKDGKIHIDDFIDGKLHQGASRNVVRDAEGLRKLMGGNLSFSPGYGIRERS